MFLTSYCGSSGHKRIIEKLWREFFADPSQWWDTRSEKINAKHPDFKHKKTKKALWVNNTLKPQWVEAELSAMAQGTVQMDTFSWNRRLARLVKAKQYEQTMELFQQMQREYMTQNTFTFVQVLKACAGLEALEEGRRLHTQIKQHGCELDVYVGSSLVDMYSKCGSIEDAQRVFNKMPVRNVVSWSSMMQAYVKCGQGQKALELFARMELEGVDPDRVTFLGMLNACASGAALEKGRHVHQQIIRRGFESDVFLGNCLVDMYAKCGSIEDGRKVFDKMPCRDVVSWSTMIQGYVKCGQGQKALDLFEWMQLDGVDPNPVTFVGVLNACTSLVALEEGKCVHEKIIQSGYGSDIFLCTRLIDMYAKCGSIDDAQIVFKNMPTRDVIAWNTMIQGYMKYGKGQKALELFGQMQLEWIIPDSSTFVSMVNACASIGALEEGRHVHQQIIVSGCENDIFVGNSLVDMYAKCGMIEDAWRVFNKMATRNVVGWNAMIQGCVKCCQGQRALELFAQMQLEHVYPDSITFVGVLNACASVAALEEGRRVHQQIIESGYENDLFVGNCLVDMYAKCGSIDDAWSVFNKMPTRDVVGWNAMIQGYVKCGHGHKALELFAQMEQLGVDPDPVTFLGVLNACASVSALENGRHIHKQIIQRGCEFDAFVGNSLVNMYLKCGSLDDAWKVFNKMPTRDVVTWSAMIQGYVKCGQGHTALELFARMQLDGVNPNPVTFLGVLNACASVVALHEGRRVHEQIIQSGYDSNVFLCSRLVDMYVKCGSIEDARRVFTEMPTRDLVSWNAMIQGYVKCGQGQNALELFVQMQLEGVHPDHITYLGALNACIDLGALEEGRLIHEQIIRRNCESDVFVGCCLVNMYTKCGSIEDGWRVFNKIPVRNVSAWNAMIQGYVKCRSGHKSLELFSQMQLEGLDPDRGTFAAVLNACCSIESLEEGRHVHEQIIQSGCESDDSVGNCLVDMYMKCGSIDDACRVFKKMPSRDVFSWNAMIQGYVSCGKWLKALELFGQMQLEGVSRDLMTFMIMLDACCSVVALEQDRNAT